MHQTPLMAMRLNERRRSVCDADGIAFVSRNGITYVAVHSVAIVSAKVGRMRYFERVADGELQRRLAAMGAVVVEGPKACGKTETARQLSASEVLLDVDDDARAAIGFDPGLVLEGPTPRLIDEWQAVPEVWNHVRRAIDNRQATGQFILTGSAVPADDAVRHTGAGRLTRLRMRPMSLFELGSSTGEVSLRTLLAGELERGARAEIEPNDLFRLVCVGGWPGHLRLSATDALQANRDYLEEVRRVDINRVDGVTRDPDRVGRLLRSYARNVATQASMSTIAADTERCGRSHPKTYGPRLRRRAFETHGSRGPTRLGTTPSLEVHPTKRTKAPFGGSLLGGSRTSGQPRQVAEGPRTVWVSL